LNKTPAKRAVAAAKKVPAAAKTTTAQHVGQAIAAHEPRPTSAVAVARPAPRPKSRATARQALPTPAPAPITNRFTDRFAPARAPIRSHDEPLDAGKPAAKDPKLANAWKNKEARDLSEPELLAMPDAEYMNDKQREFFRLRLQALKDDLLSNAGETTEHLREDTTIVPDPADRATIEEEHALELRTRDRERKLLKKIGQSLARVESGDYGFCDETGEPIGLARLLARPTATLSLEAQQRREMKQKMFGD